MFENERRNVKRGRQERLIILAGGIITGLLIGFTFFLIMKHLTATEFDEVPSWMQGVSGALGTLVSMYAVYLVNQTLKETRNTLETTKRIGEAQTRPWLLIASGEVTRQTFLFEFKFSVVNYSEFPASNITVEQTQIITDTVEDDDQGNPIYHEIPKSVGVRTTNYLIPAGKIECVTSPMERGDVEVRQVDLKITVRYSALTSETEYKHEFVVKFYIENHYIKAVLK